MTQKIWSVSFRKSIQSITWPKKEVVLQEVVDKRKTVNEKNVSKAISFLGANAGYSVYLLSWYKSTGTKVNLCSVPQTRYSSRKCRDAQFTCFTGTKVHTLTHSAPHPRLSMSVRLLVCQTVCSVSVKEPTLPNKKPGKLKLLLLNRLWCDLFPC